MLSMLARHSAFQRHVHVVFICLLFIFFIKDSGISIEKNCLLSVCQPICLVSCAVIQASEVNPEEDLTRSFHSLFSLGLGLSYAK